MFYQEHEPPHFHVEPVAQSLCSSNSAACAVDNDCSDVKYVSWHGPWRMAMRTNRSDEPQSIVLLRKTLRYLLQPTPSFHNI
jgi:hypothetical protein